MVIGYMIIPNMPTCDEICESYEQNSDKFTLVHASKYQETIATIASFELKKACACVQPARECGYSYVCQSLASAVLIVPFYDQDRVHQMVRGSVA